MIKRDRRWMMVTAAVLLVAALVGSGLLYAPDKDRASLEALYAGPPSEFVTVAGQRLHLRDSRPGASGDVQTLVLLHGFGASLHTWERWAQGLADDYRVVRIDLPGAGLTGADPADDYSDARFVALLTALLDARGVARATIVGHSMGGRLAWRYAAAEPSRVDRLVLIAPDGFASPGFEYGKAPAVSPFVHLMRWVLPRAIVRSSLKPAYADPAAMTEADVTRYHDLLLAPQVRRATIARMEQLVLQEPTPILRTIAAPTLLLWGDRDALIPARHAEDYLRALPNARAVVLPGVGHLPHEESPEASLAALRTFLQEPRPAAAP